MNICHGSDSVESGTPSREPKRVAARAPWAATAPPNPAGRLLRTGQAAGGGRAAEKEIALWFPEGVVSWKKSDDAWIYEAK